VAAFRFRMQALLALKEQLEGQAKHALRKASAAYAREQEELRGIEGLVARTMDEFRAASGGRFVAGSMKEYNAFLARQRERERRQREAVADAARAVERARAALVQAMQDREKYEKLRERQREAFLEEEKRAEQLAADERASYLRGGGSPQGA